MNTKTLKQFLALAETLHFGNASKLCHISPSALSRSIKQLEDELHVALFHRDNRSVQLTHEGKLFLTYAKEALQEWDLIKEQLAEESSELHGELSVYCSVTASYSFLYTILSRFRDNFPGVEIKLHTGDPDHAISRVLQGQEDISIAAKPDTIHKDLSFKLVGESPLQFIAPLNASEALKEQLNELPQIDWRSIPMILSEEGVSRSRTEQWFSERDIVPNIYAQVAGNEAIVSMVSLGFGIGVVPQIVLDNSPLAHNIEILPIIPALDPYEVGLFTLQKKLRNPIIDAFWSMT